MSILTLIQSRRSVRTFDGRALKEEDAAKIIDYAEKVKNPYDLPITWKLIDNKKESISCPVIVGTDVFIAGKMRRAAHAEEAFGYAFERIVLFVQSLGIGTTWIAGTMDRSGFERAMKLNEDEVMPCVSPLGYEAKKMSLRETMMRKGVKADTRLPFASLFFDGTFDTPLSESKASTMKNALEAVRLAPSAVNKQPWRIVLCDNKVHFYEKHNRSNASDGRWDVQKIDMGIALCHFELAAKEAGQNVVFEINDPHLPAPADTEYIASFVIHQA